MSPYLYAWLHRKSVSFVKKQPQKASPPQVRDPHPGPKPGSVGEARPRRTNPGFSDSLPDLRRALFGKRLLRGTVPKSLNLQSHPQKLLLLLSELPFQETELPFQETELLFRETELPFPETELRFPEIELPFRETTPGRPDSRPDPIAQEDTPPPAYAILNPRGSTPQDATPHRQRPIYENVTLETLRAHNPATRTPRPDSQILEPPPHRMTPYGVADAAACGTVRGINRAFDEQDPRMVAARTAQAIAVAVSTSRSYTAFLAAVTAAETFALLSMEDASYQVDIPSDQLRDRYAQAISIATKTSVAADASLTASEPSCASDCIDSALE